MKGSRMPPSYVSPLRPRSLPWLPWYQGPLSLENIDESIGIESIGLQRRHHLAGAPIEFLDNIGVLTQPRLAGKARRSRQGKVGSSVCQIQEERRTLRAVDEVHCLLRKTRG